MHLSGLQRLIDSIDYIERNLEYEIEIDQVAAVAHMSKFHFQRMFHILTGVTVAEYVRKRRLTIAAQELIQSNSKVIDVALKYGYETPESFSKAFRRVHGLSPSTVKNKGQSLKAFPKLSFQIQIKGDVEMDYRIVERKAFRIMGKGIQVTTRDGENLRRIPEFWQETNTSQFGEELEKASGPMGVLGVCMEFDSQQDLFTYFIAVEKNDEAPADWEEKVIPASTWAVFEAVGPLPGSIQKVWERIFSEWFPSTGYEHANAPEMEVYPIEGKVDDDDHRCEVWIPIMKK
ncbi:GyrI-like domain-containing protein [Ornithinibacillus salinisoli]|uniref:GyrI-like domain-containing protein n=1 Tax=Ornithinibacillus salinisoli TaxID=1848459 RepID=A0ABW4W0E3_9BACI